MVKFIFSPPHPKMEEEEVICIGDSSLQCKERLPPTSPKVFARTPPVPRITKTTKALDRLEGICHALDRNLFDLNILAQLKTENALLRAQKNRLSMERDSARTQVVLLQTELDCLKAQHLHKEAQQRQEIGEFDDFLRSLMSSDIDDLPCFTDGLVS